MKIVCLANSFRTGGRCLGGVELDQNNNPVFQNNRPKWVRPVCNTENEEDYIFNIIFDCYVRRSGKCCSGSGYAAGR